jgi:hypothetical protein
MPRHLDFKCQRFGTLCSIFIGEQALLTYEDGTECSETLALKIQKPGNQPEEITQPAQLFYTSLSVAIKSLNTEVSYLGGLGFTSRLRTKLSWMQILMFLLRPAMRLPDCMLNSVLGYD